MEYFLLNSFSDKIFMYLMLRIVAKLSTTAGSPAPAVSIQLLPEEKLAAEQLWPAVVERRQLRPPPASRVACPPAAELHRIL
jgi:hypothetical protein